MRRPIDVKLAGRGRPSVVREAWAGGWVGGDGRSPEELDRSEGGESVRHAPIRTRMSLSWKLGA